jgi:hypothetical protein
VRDFDGSTPGVDVQITGNTIKDVDGNGILRILKLPASKQII